MSTQPDFPQVANGITRSPTAPNDAGLDERPFYLAQTTAKRAETLFHQGRVEEALGCCRQALPSAQHDPDLLQIIAWVFSNAGYQEEAAQAYRALIAQCPQRIEFHRHLSSSLAALGREQEAIGHAQAASDLSPPNGEFALHAGWLLLNARRYHEAAPYLQRAVAAEPANPRALLAQAELHDALGHRDQALSFALHAAEYTADDGEAAIHAAELLMRHGDAPSAAALLHRCLRQQPQPMLLRVLSTAEMLQGDLAAALEAAEAAIARAPDVAEYHVHCAHLLSHLGDMAAAAAALDDAARIDPTNEEIKRAQLSLYLAAGLVTEATAVGGELLQRFPDHRPAAEAVLHLLTHRLDTIDGEYVVLGDTARAARPPPSEPGLIERLRTQARVINALIIRETRTRFGEARLGYAWALVEPILHITLLSVTFAVLMHGQPPIGAHFFIFYFTGLIRYSGADGTSFSASGCAEVRNSSLFAE